MFGEWQRPSMDTTGAVVQAGDPTVVEGSSDRCPILSVRGCNVGVNEYTLRVEGDNGVMIGVAEAGCDVNTKMYRQVNRSV